MFTKLFGILRKIEETLINILIMNKKQTSPKVATKASEILRDPNSTKKEKSVAASDLAQARGKGKKSK
jgi:hypothetical protein